jgi:hypothetical protein
VLNLLLLLLGSVLILVTIMITIVFVLAGGLRRSLQYLKIPLISGTVGFLMIALGLLPWTVAATVGLVAVAVGAVFFIWSSHRQRRGLRPQRPNVRAYLSVERVKPALRFFKRMGMILAVILLADVLGLWGFLQAQGAWNLLSFSRQLPLLLLLEGALIGAAGGFMFLGYSEYRISEQGAINPAIAADQREGWKERRLSQQKWGTSLLIAGVLLILLGLVLDYLFYFIL